MLMEIMLVARSYFGGKWKGQSRMNVKQLVLGKNLGHSFKIMGSPQGYVAFRFQKSDYTKTKLFKTEGRGWGLLADENVKAGRFIIEYCGELISSEEAKQRSLVYEAQGRILVYEKRFCITIPGNQFFQFWWLEAGLKDAYIISLYANYFIDATKKGSLARFINHSCQPNCETRKWTVLGEVRVGIFAKQDIYAGTELAYDYNFEWYGGANVRCLCGAPNCSKFLGAKSPAFLEHNHVWEEGDDRYTVEEIPLYDSAEDEPSLKLPKDKRSFGLDFLDKNNISMVTVDTVGPERQLESSAAVVEPLHSVPTEHVAINMVKAESSEEKKIYSQDTQNTFPPTNATTSQFQSSSAFRNFQIGSGSLPKKKSFSINKKSKNNGGKQLDGKRVARLFASKQAQEEILKCEEIRNQAATKLEASYDEIRPAIEEHERDSQDNVDISAAMTWIGASCAKMKADFNFHFAIVKNVVCPQTPQNTCDEAKPSEGADNENGAKY
ncbi:hypothetical protein Acr_21g0005650 [Actinidia rufa]|uniref:Uncharacterized protein n=1 Tax=Actinidia rufa TaxID=165716 RepID=A0A7J0GGN6_9ERIC|nr:hypothetical protein Acr_21g0005650 [Actinidia rufa]